jgi:hypothetical protein
MTISFVHAYTFPRTLPVRTVSAKLEGQPRVAAADAIRAAREQVAADGRRNFGATHDAQQ